MKKESRRWKVFLIVLCMLVTMMPATVFADDIANQTPGTQVQETQQAGESDGQGTSGDVTPPEGGGSSNTATPPGDDTATEPGISEGDDTTTEPGISEGDETTTEPGISEGDEDPADPVTLPALEVPEAVTGEGIQMMNSWGVQNGYFKVVKTVENKPSGAPDATFEFDIYEGNWEWDFFKWEYVWNGDNDPDYYLSVVGSQNVNESDEITLPKGDYKVVERTLDNYTIDKDQKTQYVKIERNKQHKSLAFTNTYNGPTTGSLTIEKSIQSDRAVPETVFEFTVASAENEYSETVYVTGGAFVTLEDLGAGQYTVTEANADGFTPISEGGYEQTANVAIGETATVSFINALTGPTTGAITVTKHVDREGGGTVPYTEFSFEMTGPGYFNEFRLNSTTNGSITIPGLPPGHYVVTEAETNGFIPEENDYDKDVTVRAGETANVEFTNTYITPTTGAITITKHVESAEGVSVPLAQFEFYVTGPGGYHDRFTVDNGENPSVTIQNLTPGDYVVLEAESNGFRPANNDYDKDVTVEPGATTTVEFTNIYETDNPSDPEVWVIKDVALYNGSTVPVDSEFVKQLNLTELNKKVIYRIRIGCNDAWIQSERMADLNDIYSFGSQAIDITDKLLIWDALENKFVIPESLYMDDTLYYIDQYPENSVFTNTAYLYEARPTLNKSSGDGEYEMPILSSSSAIVTVYYKPNDNNNGGGGGGGSHHNYYDVTYNSNFPGITGTGGTVPVDGTNYSYNNPVNVKGNTGDLKAGDYVFKGWNTKPDGTGTMYQSGSTFNITADTVLYAIWEVAANETIQQSQTSTEPQPADTTSAPGSEPSSELDNVPKTGDSTPLLLMLLLSILSIASIELFGRRKTFKVNTDK